MYFKLLELLSHSILLLKKQCLRSKQNAMNYTLQIHGIHSVTDAKLQDQEFKVEVETQSLSCDVVR